MYTVVDLPLFMSATAFQKDHFSTRIGIHGRRLVFESVGHGVQTN